MNPRRAAIETEISGLQLLIDMADDLEDSAMAKRSRKKIRALRAELKAVAK